MANKIIFCILVKFLDTSAKSFFLRIRFYSQR